MEAIRSSIPGLAMRELIASMQRLEKAHVAIAVFNDGSPLRSPSGLDELVFPGRHTVWSCPRRLAVGAGVNDLNASPSASHAVSISGPNSGQSYRSAAIPAGRPFIFPIGASVNRLRKKSKAGLLQRTLEQQKEQLNALLERRHEKHEHAAIVDKKPSRLGRLWNRVRQILKGVSA
jgi:hypothetical protein